MNYRQNQDIDWLNVLVIIMIPFGHVATMDRMEKGAGKMGTSLWSNFMEVIL